MTRNLFDRLGDGPAGWRCVAASRRVRPADGAAWAGRGATIAAMLDHEEKFLFKEEILHLANAVG